MINAAELPIHVIDFEGSEGTGILEYGVVTLHRNEWTQAVTRLCRSTGRVTALDTAHHGITFEDTEEACPFSDEWDRFVELRKTGVFCAHYASFENRLLKSVWPYPPKSPSYLEVEESIADWGPWVDTCKLCQTVYPHLTNYKLSYLVNQLGLSDPLRSLAAVYAPVGRRSFHCALYDALASALLLKHILNLPGYQAATVAWLIHNSASSSKSKEQPRQRFLF